MHSLTQHAIAAIGTDAPTDWELKPDMHAAELGPDATPLRQILCDPDLKSIIASYGAADQQAQRAQRLYKRLAGLSAWTGFMAAAIGALVLMFAVLIAPGPMLTVAVALQALLLVTSLGASLIIGQLTPFETWMQHRATAENARRTLFETVMQERAQGDAAAALPLQLEYFRRYQLDVQRYFYRQRGRQHVAAARAAWWWRLIALALIVIASFPLIWTLQHATWLPDLLTDATRSLPQHTELAQRVFLGIGIIAAALQGLLASLAVTSLHERNGARYLSTADNLDALADRPLADARLAAAEAAAGIEAAIHDGRNDVLAFIALVHDQISSEHREWVSLRKLAPDLALDRIKSLRLPPRA